MFDHAKAQRRREVLAPKPAGIKKSPAARNGGFFKPFATARGENAWDQMLDPDYFTKRRKHEEPCPQLPVQGFAGDVLCFLQHESC